MSSTTAPKYNPKKPDATYASKPTGVPKGYVTYYDPTSKRWIVAQGTSPTSGGSTPGTLSPISSMTVPQDIINQYQLPKNLSLSYNPGANKGAPYAPTTGKELYDAIGQAKAEGKITSAEYTRLISFAFGSGFNIGNANASKMLAAVTLELGSNNYSLTNYKVPTGQTLNSPAVLNFMHTEQANAQANLSNAQTTQQSLQLNQRQYTATVSATTVNQELGAYTSVMNYLDNWGLGSLSDYVWKMVTKPGDNMIKYEGILDAIRGIAPSNLGKAADEAMVAAYNKAFPGLTQYNNGTNNVHFTESQYQTYAQNIINTSSNAGIPVPTNQQIGQLLNNQVSAAEYQKRVTDIYDAVKTADANTKAFLKSEYGIDDSSLMAYVTTGSFPEKQRQVATAQIQGYAQDVGLNNFNQAQASELADRARLTAAQGNQNLGVGVSVIQQALLNASKDVPLTASLPGAGGTTLDTNTMIGAQVAGFQGTNQQAAQTQVLRAEQARVAPFEKGGGYAETAKGVTGIGSAKQ